MTKAKFHKIQALRAIAAILVAVDHSLTFLVGHNFTEDQITPFAWFLGEQGVSIFFIISGFIMAHSTQGRSGSVQAVSRFVRNRLIRIVPPYWIFTLLAAALITSGVWLKGRQVAMGELLQSLAFIPYGDGAHAMRPVLGQGWTLNYEMLFYAIFALSLYLPQRAGRLSVITVLLSLVAAGVLRGTSMAGGDPLTMFDFYTSPLLLLFAVGIVIGHFAHRGVVLHLGRHGLVLSLVALIVGATVFALLVNTYKIPLPWRLLFWGLDGVGVALCALVGPSKHDDDAASLWETLGDASYSIYLVHLFALTIVAKVWASLFHWQAPWLFVLVAPAAGIVAGYVAWRWIERPVTHWLRGRLFTQP